jgi:hypothetical protein
LIQSVAIQLNRHNLFDGGTGDAQALLKAFQHPLAISVMELT